MQVVWLDKNRSTDLRDSPVYVQFVHETGDPESEMTDHKNRRTTPRGTRQSHTPIERRRLCIFRNSPQALRNDTRMPTTRRKSVQTETPTTRKRTRSSYAEEEPSRPNTRSHTELKEQIQTNPIKRIRLLCRTPPKTLENDSEEPSHPPIAHIEGTEEPDDLVIPFTSEPIRTSLSDSSSSSEAFSGPLPQLSICEDVSSLSEDALVLDGFILEPPVLYCTESVFDDEDSIEDELVEGSVGKLIDSWFV
ncbi:hypothetical protein PROFUN_02120 [Planoprotostelium fungivorum]|uniref:Uncharacterized protein n=1 Tax=Planoprotostelium fungivorum TaxID=1890364 RepID=A0A2P6NZ60_9EUKA|nr:hypothetical protein PROFUN_02120 [Planoprotostelium fungivorum]